MQYEKDLKICIEQENQRFVLMSIIQKKSRRGQIGIRWPGMIRTKSYLGELVYEG